MRKTNVNFCGPILSRSGYGEASRYFIYALYQAGVDVSVDRIRSRVPPALNLGKKGQLCRRLLRKPDGSKINVIHMVPVLFDRLKKPRSKNIGFTTWEADRLPRSWVSLCNRMDAIFVPSKWNVDVFRSSGVKVPIHLVQPGVDPEDTPIVESRKPSDKYTFYSIFQWSERKNPKGLISTYLSEFVDVKDVRLILKTHGWHGATDTLRGRVQIIRSSLNIDHSRLPEIQIETERYSAEQMSSLHRDSDCFVLPSCGEGWGMPYMESMSYGNPTIGTGYSGNMDFMNEENSYLLPYSLKPVANMKQEVPWYDGTMWWAEADLKVLASTMRRLYSNRDEGVRIGSLGREHILSNFNIETSANQFMEAIDSL